MQPPGVKLNRDVLEIVLKKLPIETRVSLRVPPNRVTVSDDVAETISRMVRVAMHPNRLRYTWARVEGELELVRCVSMMHMTVFPDSVNGDPEPWYRWISADRKQILHPGWYEFCPIPQSYGTSDVFQWQLDELTECESRGAIC